MCINNSCSLIVFLTMNSWYAYMKYEEMVCDFNKKNVIETHS